MYFAGIDQQHGIGVIISQWLDIRPVPDVRNTMDRTLYDTIESVFVKVWSLGICHMDAHLNNICLHSDGSIKLVDWGHAAFLPTDAAQIMQTELQRNISSPIHETVWKKVQARVPYNLEDRLRSQVVYKACAGKADPSNADWIVLKKLWRMVPNNNRPGKPQQRPVAKKPRRSSVRVMTFSSKDGKIQWRKFPDTSAWSQGILSPSPVVGRTRTLAVKNTKTVSSDKTSSAPVTSNRIRSSNIRSSPLPDLQNSNMRNSFSNKRL
jgi:hypothetical protein